MSHEWNCACPRCLRDWRIAIEDARPDEREADEAARGAGGAMEASEGEPVAD